MVLKNSENLLRGIHSKKYETRFSQVDYELITYFTASFKSNIWDSLIEIWEKEKSIKQAETSMKLFYKKRLVFKYHNYRIKEEEKKREKTNVQR